MSRRISAPLHVVEPIQIGPSIYLSSTVAGALVVSDRNLDALDLVRPAEPADLDLATQRLDWLDVCPDDGDVDVALIVGPYTVRRCICTDGTWRLYASHQTLKIVLILDPEVLLDDHLTLLNDQSPKAVG